MAKGTLAVKRNAVAQGMTALPIFSLQPGKTVSLGLSTSSNH
jgi:hypothetical protein